MKLKDIVKKYWLLVIIAIIVVAILCFLPKNNASTDDAGYKGSATETVTDLTEAESDSELEMTELEDVTQTESSTETETEIELETESMEESIEPESESVSEIDTEVSSGTETEVSTETEIAPVPEPEYPKGIIVTQYPDVTGGQAMFYTLEAQGKLYVVDGGTGGNASYVRQVIAEKGNKVEAWILTHPHPDHIGAFNEIYSALGDVQLGTIYAVEMDYDTFKNHAQPWDDFPTYDKWYSLTKDATNLKYLHEGDTLNFDGMRLEVYHALSLENPFTGPGQDPINWTSMVFEIFGDTESMLFSSDINKATVCDFVMSRHGEQLQANYFQIGHHGNWSVTHEFILKVNPKVVFFDTPQWLFEGTQYDASSNRDFCIEQGMQVLTYSTAPNVITIH